MALRDLARQLKIFGKSAVDDFSSGAWDVGTAAGTRIGDVIYGQKNVKANQQAADEARRNVEFFTQKAREARARGEDASRFDAMANKWNKQSMGFQGDITNYGKQAGEKMQRKKIATGAARMGLTVLGASKLPKVGLTKSIPGSYKALKVASKAPGTFQRTGRGGQQLLNIGIQGGLGSVISGGLTGLMGGSGDQIAEAAGTGLGSAVRLSGLNKLTNPAFDHLFGKVNAMSNPVLRLTARPFAGAMTNLAEDEFYTRATEGRAPTAQERRISASLGAIMPVAGAVTNKIMPDKEPPKPLTQQRKEKGIKLRAAGKYATPEQKAAYNAKQPEQNIPNVLNTQERRLGRAAAKMYDKTMTLDEYMSKYGDNTPMNAALGGAAGIELYQDEDGKMKFRYNKERGMIGVAAGIGGKQAIDAIKKQNIKLSDLPKPEKLGDAEAGPKMARDMLSIPAQLLNRGFPQQVVDSLNNNQIKKLLDNNITPSQYKRMMELRGTQQLEANRAEAMVADEMRSQFSDNMIKKINRLKAMMRSDDLQGGDIGNLYDRDSKLTGDIVEAVRELPQYEHLSDSDAIDIALNLPTKVQTRVQSPAELKTARQLKQELDARSKAQKIDRVDALGKPETKTAFDKRFAEANQGLRYDAPVTEYQKTRQIARDMKDHHEEWQKALYSQSSAVYKDVKAVERAARGPKSKVNLLDEWLRTPDRVMKKIGLEKEAKLLRTKYQDYLMELPENMNKVNQWYEKVGKSKDSSRKIFRYMDGEKTDIDKQPLKLSETEMEVAKEMKAYMDEWADRLGLPKDRRMAHYITHIFENDFIQKDFDPDLEKLLQSRVPGSVYDPFLQQRLGKQGYIEDAFRAMDAYVKRATRKVHMDQALEQVKEASQDLDITSWNYVKEYTDRINMRPMDVDKKLDNLLKLTPGIGYKMTDRPTAYATRKIRNWIYRGTLGFNVGSALKNLTQGTNTYAKLGEKWTGVGYMKALQSLKGGSEELNKVGVLSDTFIQDKNISSMKRFSEKLDKALFFMFEGVEKINRGAAYYGAKSKALAEGKTEKEAIQAGIDLARDTQFTFGSVDTPVKLQGDIVKTLTQFQSFSIKQGEFLTEMAQKKEYAGMIRWLGANIALLTVAGDLLGMDYMDLIPSVRIGGSPFFNLAGDAAAVAVNAPDEYGNERDTQDKVKLLAEDVVPFIPGGVQAKKTIQGFTANDEGGSYSKSGRLQFPVTKTSDKVIAPILGKYRTTGASRKFDEDLNVLSEKQTQMYRQLYSQDPQKAQAYYDQIIGQRKMKAGAPEKKTLGSLFGKPAMASEETPVVKDSNYYDSINEGIKSGYATPEQAYEYYMRGIDTKPHQSKYQENIRQKEIFKRLGEIDRRETFDDATKFRLETSLLENAGIKRSDYEYYKIAKNTDGDSDAGTLLAQDIYKDVSREDFLYTLEQGRKEVNGKRMVNDTVLKNLRDEGLLSDAEYKRIKNMKWDAASGSVKASKSGSGKKLKSIRTSGFKLPSSKPQRVSIKLTQPQSRKTAINRPRTIKIKAPKIPTIAIGS